MEAAETEPPSAGDEANRVARLPRWTRQEILVLIQGKRVAENRVRRGRMSGPAFGSGQAVEPKWASVSSYCKRHGVNRGPVQCRKRWSNLAGDFKKIKEWETGREAEATESFWVMRNDLRREKKLPGFFDREVYDILDSSDDNAAAANPNPLPLPPPPAVFDSGRSAAADDGLFSDSDQQHHDHDIVNPPPLALPLPSTSGKQQQQQASAQDPDVAATHEKQPSSNPDVATTQEGRKRKRPASEGDGEMHLQHQLIETLERNGTILSSQLEIQNNNFQSDMELRKDHGNSLIAVLDKLADALGRIADKL
ncbi:hypothetical protein ACET3Z_025774 [Daucus carota]